LNWLDDAVVGYCLPWPVVIACSVLQVFIVRNNLLNGSCEALEACTNLRYLDVAVSCHQQPTTEVMSRRLSFNLL
jgi:hypothetical protein